MTPERLKEIQKLFENGGNDFLEQIDEIVPELIDSALRLAKIEGAGDEEVEKACEGLMKSYRSLDDNLFHKSMNSLDDIAKSRNATVADLRAKLGESEKRIAELQPLLGDSATYIRRMARMLRDHPSRIQLRAIDFVTKKLSAFERHIVPMNGDEPA